MLTRGYSFAPGYRLQEFLGRGQFGQVWRATAPGGTVSAVKFIDLTGGQGQKEYAAIKRMKAIQQANLMPITAIWLLDETGEVIDDQPDSAIETVAFDVASGEDPSGTIAIREPAMLVVAMLLGGKSLLDRMKECLKDFKTGIPARELLSYMEDSAKGLDFLNQCEHDLGDGPVAIQHCDVKPANIVLLGNSAVICDFGLARLLNQNQITATSASGTPAYMAPEAIEGKPSQHSDQYSLAITFYHLRTGTLPMKDGTLFEVLDAHRRGNLTFKSIPDAEAEVLRQATHLDWEQRFASCGDFVDAMRDAMRGQTATAIPARGPVVGSGITGPVAGDTVDGRGGMTEAAMTMAPADAPEKASVSPAMETSPDGTMATTANVSATETMVPAAEKTLAGAAVHTMIDAAGADAIGRAGEVFAATGSSAAGDASAAGGGGVLGHRGVVAAGLAIVGVVMAWLMVPWFRNEDSTTDVVAIPLTVPEPRLGGPTTGTDIWTVEQMIDGVLPEDFAIAKAKLEAAIRSQPELRAVTSVTVGEHADAVEQLLVHDVSGSVVSIGYDQTPFFWQSTTDGLSEAPLRLATFEDIIYPAAMVLLGDDLVAAGAGQWRWWNVAAEPREIATGSLEGSDILAVAIDPKSRRAAIAASDGHVTIVREGQQTPADPQRFPLPGEIDRMVWSPDGRWLACVLQTASLVQFDLLANRSGSAGIASPVQMGSSDEGVRRCVFSDDGQSIYTGHAGGTVTRWSPSDPATPVRRHQAHRGNVESLAWCQAGVLSGADDGTLAFWSSDASARSIRLSNSPIASVDVSADGRTAVAGTYDGMIFVLDPNQDAHAFQFLTGSDAVDVVRLDPRRNRILAGCSDGRIRVLPLAHCRMLAEIVAFEAPGDAAVPEPTEAKPESRI